MDWGAVAERQRGRFEQAETAVLRGNAAYGAALALLMSGRGEDGLGRAFRNNEATVIIADDQVSRSDRDARFERCPPTWLA